RAVEPTPCQERAHALTFLHKCKDPVKPNPGGLDGPRRAGPPLRRHHRHDHQLDEGQVAAAARALPDRPLVLEARRDHALAEAPGGGGPVRGQQRRTPPRSTTALLTELLRKLADDDAVDPRVKRWCSKLLKGQKARMPPKRFFRTKKAPEGGP